MAPRIARLEREPLANEPVCEQAQATRDLAASIDRFTDRIGPAADTVHGLGERLDNLCKWLKSAWPWLGVLLATLIWQSPEKAPALIDALTKMLGGH